jgi:GT2 family glycosyltransferase
LVQVQPLVSVIILNYNGEAYLQNCLASVLKSQYPNFEVILVDNASTDRSLKKAQEAFVDPRLKIVQNTQNLGFSGGNNVGFEHSSGEYLVFLNNDTIVQENWLASLVDAMQSDPSIGLAQSKIINMNSDVIQNAGWLFSNYLVRKHPVGEKRRSNVEFESVYEVSVASGASMIARRYLIDEVGLFDPKIPFFYDDTLLSFKTWLANKRVVVVENSRIRHIMGATSSWNTEAVTYNLLKAKICLMFDVYYRLNDLAKAALVNFVYTMVISLFTLRKKNLPAIYGTCHALTWGLGNLRYLWQNRLNHWGKTKIAPDELKQKFVRITLPVALYLLPSKLSNDYFAFEVRKYEDTVKKR